MAAKAVRRQVILGASAERHLSVILGEAALRQAVGGPGVMAGQISHLVRLIDDFPGLALQVLPFTAGAHAAAGSASLAILRFPDAPGLGVVYLEALSGGVYLEGQEDVARYIRAFALLRAAALSPAESARLLSGLQCLTGGPAPGLARSAAHAAVRMPQLLGHGRELVDDVLDVLEGFLGSRRSRRRDAALASGGTETAGFVRPCSAGVLHAVAGVHAGCLLEVMPG